MKKEISRLLIMLICSNIIASQENRFCGFYGGANINFGPIIIQSSSNSNQQTDFNNDINSPIQIFGSTNNNLCEVLYHTLDTLGAGITMGYQKTLNCSWLAGAEFNALFFGDLRNSNMINNINTDATVTNGTITSDLAVELGRHRSFKSNMRFDGIIKFGFLVTPNSAVYLLGGGSGINLSENNSINLNFDISSSTENSSRSNLFDIRDPEELCCNSWLGGGVLGIGLKISWSECLDILVESRYSKYRTWYQSANNAENSDSSTTTQSRSFSNSFSSAHHVEAYTTMVGVNWSF